MELKQESAKAAALTQADILARVLRAAERAESNDQPAAAIRGYELLGKQAGLFTERAELAIDDARKLTTEQLHGALLDMLAARGLTGDALQAVATALIGAPGAAEPIEDGIAEPGDKTT